MSQFSFISVSNSATFFIANKTTKTEWDPNLLHSSGFYRGFFVGGRGRGGVDPEKSFWATRRLQKNFLGLLGGYGACSPVKFWKHSVQNWLKSHFWILIIFTDSLKSSSKRSLFEITLNFFFSGKLFFGGEEAETFGGKQNRMRPESVTFIRVLSRIFCWGEGEGRSWSWKKFLSLATATKKFFRPSRGVRSMLSSKILKT